MLCGYDGRIYEKIQYLITYLEYDLYTPKFQLLFILAATLFYLEFFTYYKGLLYGKDYMCTLR